MTGKELDRYRIAVQLPQTAGIEHRTEEVQQRTDAAIDRGEE